MQPPSVSLLWGFQGRGGAHRAERIILIGLLLTQGFAE